MIQKYLKELRENRTKKEKWDEYIYKEEKDKKGYSYDANQLKRYRILLALQFNFKKTDKEFLEFLFKQELLMHHHAPFQGLYNSLQINSYLLSKFKDVSHIPLFISAKIANFDTHCGYDREYIVSSGLKKSLEYFPYLNKENQQYFENYIGLEETEYFLTKKDLKKWRKRIVRNYPSSFKSLSLEDEIDLADDLEEYKIRDKKITKWKETQVEWTEENLRKLYWYEHSKKDTKAQIKVKKQLLNYTQGDWNTALHFQTMSELYLRRNKFKAAWKNVKKATPYLDNIPKWWQYGLGRTFFEIGADIIIHENEANKLSAEIFKWMKKPLFKAKNLHLKLLRKLLKAVKILDKKEHQVYFHDSYIQEKEKLDKIKRRNSG